MGDPICGATGCDHPAPGGFVCTVCLRQLSADLQLIAGRGTDTPIGPAVADAQRARSADRGLLAELVDTLTRQDRHEPDTHRALRHDSGDDPHPDDLPIAVTPLPFHPAAGDLLRELHNEAVTWTRHLIEQRYGADLDLLARDANYRRAWPTAAGEPHGPWRQGPQLPDNDTAELARWLARHLETIRQDEAAGQLVDTFAGLVGHAKAIVYPDAMEYLGACPCAPLLCACSTPQTCGRAHELDPIDLYVPRGSVRVTCPRCGTTDDVAKRREWLLDQARDQLVTATDGSRALVDYCRDAGLREPLSASAIRGLGLRGAIAKLPPYPGSRDPRYRVGEIMDAIAKRAAKQRPRILA